MRGAPRVGFTRGGLILTVAIDPLSGQKLGTTKSKAPPLKSVKDGAPKFRILTQSGRTGVVLERGVGTILWNVKGRATLYDVVGSVKRHFECASCGQLVLVLT